MRVRRDEGTKGRRDEGTKGIAVNLRNMLMTKIAIIIRNITI